MPGFTHASKLNSECYARVNFDAGTIELRESVFQTPEYDNLQRQWTTMVLNTRDKATREALIKLGWTPPPGQ